jgi:5-formyltetrahydrofolate cyclo-ligase
MWVESAEWRVCGRRWAGMLRLMGAVDEHTLVVTSVHDSQVTTELAGRALLKHDLCVDVIVTPTRVIRTTPAVPKPTGIYWDLLSPQKLAQVKVLRELKARIEAAQGVTLPSGPDAPLPPLAARNGRRRGPPGGGGGSGRGGGDAPGGSRGGRGQGSAGAQ